MKKKKKPFPNGNLKAWALVAWILRKELGKKEDK